MRQRQGQLCADSGGRRNRIFVDNGYIGRYGKRMFVAAHLHHHHHAHGASGGGVS